MPTQQQLDAALAKGYTPQQIKLALAKSGVQNKPKQNRKGVSKWLFGDRTSLPGMALEGASNVLSLPSYAIGGMMDEFQQKGAGALNPLKNPLGLAGAYSGIKNKEAIMRELPESFGMDPNSGAGMALGFAGELMTPGVPLGKVANVFKSGKAASRLTPNVFSKVGKKLAGIPQDAGNTLLMKSYKLNKTDINNIAKAIGVKNESEKASKVLAYLENMGLNGSTMGSAKKLDNLTQEVQDTYNALVRTGKPVGRETYAQALFDQAAKLEKFAGDPGSRRIVNELLEESEKQFSLAGHKVGMTDTFLTNTKTKAFAAASPGQLSSPFETGVNEQIGRAGVNALETIAPGSKTVGTKLRGMQTAQDVVGGQARTGLGTQLLNVLKPGAVGFGVGAGAGYAQGENPLLYGVAGAVGGNLASTPQAMNAAGKILTNTSKYSPAINKGFSAGSNIAGKSIVTGARLATTGQYQQKQTNKQAGSSSQVGTRVQTLPKLPVQKTSGTATSSAYPSIIPSGQKVRQLQYKPPTTRLQTNTAFGKNKQVKRGSFY